ncbi:rhoptry neck protein RON10 [Besnoitia besnoiti]|uniref:Rhoptry neck protein RON10 n=1 Tax=Besnoitia besnoiti TaxID=94643 RepID=A0A2A9MNP5_BESBE|nr:rhoptry neck protein RON10 [Besnoitia besnoiti]PFH37876.1 rhoptry neck protein RON10 [Besnoitia besnoiti]
MPEVDSVLGIKHGYLAPRTCRSQILFCPGVMAIVSFSLWTILFFVPAVTPHRADGAIVSGDKGRHETYFAGRRPESLVWGAAGNLHEGRHVLPHVQASAESVELPSFIETGAEPSRGGLWSGLKQYVELGTSEERSPVRNGEEAKNEQTQEVPPEESARRAEASPSEAERSEDGTGNGETAGDNQQGRGEDRQSRGQSEQLFKKETGTESAEYHRLAQKELREARAGFVKQTGGTPEEYGETGDFPSLCGAWQTVPSSPHFASNTKSSRYSEDDASLLSEQSNAGDPLPYPTCQWLPRRGIHISERRTYGFEPNVVDIERLEFHSKEGCLPNQLAKIWLYSGFWQPKSAATDPKTKAEEMTVQLSWMSVEVQMDVNAVSHAQHLMQPAAISGTPTAKEKQCWEEGDRLWLPPVKQMHLDLRDICTEAQGNILYSQPVPPEFMIVPQEIPVSHEVLAKRLKRRLRRRLTAMQAKHGKQANLWQEESLKEEAEKAIETKWTDAIEKRFVTRWRDYLVQQNLWTEKVCQWQLLRESCLVPPPLAGQSKNEHVSKEEKKKMKEDSLCYIPMVRHSLSREEGIDYLEVPLFPFTKEAEHVRMRKVGGCNPHLKVSLQHGKDAEKLAEEQQRHTAREELASVTVVSKTIRPHEQTSSAAAAEREETTAVPAVSGEKEVKKHEQAEAQSGATQEKKAENAPAEETEKPNVTESGSKEEPETKTEPAEADHPEVEAPVPEEAAVSEQAAGASAGAEEAPNPSPPAGESPSSAAVQSSEEQPAAAPAAAEATQTSSEEETSAKAAEASQPEAAAPVATEASAQEAPPDQGSHTDGKGRGESPHAEEVSAPEEGSKPSGNEASEPEKATRTGEDEASGEEAPSSDGVPEEEEGGVEESSPAEEESSAEEDA